MAARDASSDEERASGERALGERAHVRLRASVIKRTSWPEVRKVRRLTPNPSSRSPAKSCRILAASPVAAATIASPQVESAAICRSRGCPLPKLGSIVDLPVQVPVGGGAFAK